ncbi:precorrin-6y C5,15-methyltransferase (decarboxylating) subunit CbiE [Inquilinus sp. NPDC058860]|uniref:precorrin-6y C5,15-methyltransferase (decarboxylating) subunit CbiE n=1 Tax=Inquilinus sp. NPDC058860 TaxID=3346652 RepID=UPI00368C01A3
MTPWLSVIGIGEDGLDGLSPAARALYDAAEIVVGGKRHLEMVPEDGRRRIPWPPQLLDLVPEIEALRGRRVCVLASGDPMCFGIGVTLSRRIPIAEMVVLPAPSAFSLACARLGWPLVEARMVTLHGRPLELVVPHLQPGAKILVLSADRTTPARLAELLRRTGWGRSGFTVLERMGGEGERIVRATAESWDGREVDDLNTIAIDCMAGPETRVLPAVPGLPDDAFAHDGQLTKREVRAMTLAALAPSPGQVLWDVGAGCGSIAIEWMRSDPRCRAVAVERDDGRLALIAQNAAALGTPFLKLVRGDAPAALAGDLPRPDAVFIGGGITVEGLVESCWAALPPGGRLVANVVTAEGEAAVIGHQSRLGGALSRIAVSRAEPIGGYHGWRPLMPVTQWAAVKPWGAS